MDPRQELIKSIEQQLKKAPWPVLEFILYFLLG